MKKVKLILAVVTAMLLLGVSSVNAQEKSTEMVIIRITETSSRKGSGIIITDSEGKINKIELARDWIDESGNNQMIIQNELKKWKQEGYKITHLSTSGSTSGDVPISRTTIILEK